MPDNSTAESPASDLGNVGSTPTRATNDRLVQLANSETFSFSHIKKTRSNKTFFTKRTSSHVQWYIEENDGSNPSPITNKANHEW